MKKTEVMFFFDTEDFTCEESQDAAKQLAEICTEEGVCGHFAVVGLVADRLRKTGRTDVIEALNKHEIGSHTWGHTVHPDICEMTDCEDFREAYANVSASEGEGLRLIREAFGRDEILFAVPPGNSKSYAAMYYYADQGIPFYCDTVVCDEQGTDTWCANAMHIAYTEAVEQVAFAGNVRETIDALAGRNRVIIYTHPNMAYFSQFWDAVNFAQYNRHPEGDYEACIRRSEEETRRYFGTLREIIRTLKADERFRITSLREILAEQKRPAPVLPGEMTAIHAALCRAYEPLRERGLRLYDVFMAAAAFLRCGTEYIPGKAYGLLNAPKEIKRAVKLTAEGVREAAQGIKKDTFLPDSFVVDGEKIGTGDMLYAMLEALERKEGEFVLEPHPEMNFLSRYPELEHMALRGTWMHSGDFQDAYLSDRLRLQAYTIR